MAARSSGREWRSAPRGDLPTAVRKQSTITASRIGAPFYSYTKIAPLRSRLRSTHRRSNQSRDRQGAIAFSIPQHLAILQHVLHAFLRLHIPAQTQERMQYMLKNGK